MKSLPKHEPKVIYISSFKRDSKIYPCCIAMIESVDEIFLFQISKKPTNRIRQIQTLSSPNDRAKASESVMNQNHWDNEDSNDRINNSAPLKFDA